MDIKNEFLDSYPQIYDHLNKMNVESAELVFCERIDEKSHDWNFDRHRHDYIELIYIIDGNMRIDVPGKTIQKGLYNLIVYPKGVMHQEVLNLHEKQKILCLGIQVKSETSLKTSFEIEDNDGSIRWLMDQICLEHDNGDEGGKVLIRLYISALFAKMRRYFGNKRQMRPDYVERSVTYIYDHIQENLSVEQLASAVYISPSHLTRLFREKLGMSPMNYVNVCRINLAKHAMNATTDGIEEIALKVGFKDPKYFSRVFKNETGMSPKGYRALISSNED